MKKHITKIAFSGKQLSGKSTLAMLLFERIMGKGGKPHILSHSSWIKYLVSTGLNRKPTRSDLQIFGSDVMINGCDSHFKCPEFWTNMVISDADHLENNNIVDFFIVDDVRFDFQADTLREEGYILVRLQTSPGLQAERKTDKEVGILNHVSEIAMDHLENKGYFDIEFSPTATMEEMLHNVLDYLEARRKFREGI